MYICRISPTTMPRKAATTAVSRNVTSIEMPIDVPSTSLELLRARVESQAGHGGVISVSKQNQE